MASAVAAAKNRPLAAAVTWIGMPGFVFFGGGFLTRRPVLRRPVVIEWNTALAGPPSAMILTVSGKYFEGYQPRAVFHGNVGNDPDSEAAGMPDRMLSDLLRRWDEPASVPGNFRAVVWDRIANRKLCRGGGFWQRMSEGIGHIFCRPALMAVVVAGVMVAGAGVAHLQVREVVAERKLLAESIYLAAISPLARIGVDGRLLIPFRTDP